jgi:hypothetical protein
MTAESRGRLSTAFGLTVLLALTGCSRYYWSRPGGSLEDFNRDSAACAKAATPQPNIFVEDSYRRCLHEHGWVRAQRIEPPPPGWYRGIE